MDAVEIGRRVRQFRNKRSLSQRALADFAQKSDRWLWNVEHGLTSLSTDDANRLAFGLRLDVAVLLGLAPAPAQLDAAHGSLALNPAMAMDPMEDAVKRRSFLDLVPGQNPVAPAGAGEHGPDLLHELEAITHAYARRSRTLPPALVLASARGHLDALQHLLAASPAGQSLRVYALGCQGALLVGRLAQLLELWAESHKHLTWAQALAREAGDSALSAHALCAMSGLHSAIPKGGRGGNPAKAIELLDDAVAAAGPDASPHLLAWMFARRAEEHAFVRSPRRARRDLEAAGRALSSAGNVDQGFFHHLDAAWLAGYHGNCARLLGRPDEAVTVLETSLRAINSERPGQRSRVLADLAAAYAGKGAVDHACELLTDALALASEGRVPVAVQRIRGIRHRHLASQANAPAVRRLDASLAEEPTSYC